MKNSTQINQELQIVLARLEGIEAKHLEAENFAAELVRKVALGEAPLSDLQTANLNAATLKSVVDEVVGNRQRLESELESAKAAEAAEALFQSAVGIAMRAEAAWDEYRTGWAKALIELEKMAGGIADAQEAHRECRLAFAALPGKETLLSELRDRDVPTGGIRAVPLQDYVYDFSIGGDIREFQGEGGTELLQRVQRTLVVRNQGK